MDQRFQGKQALVTGAGRGIGKDVAIALSKDGAKVFALDISQDRLDALKQEHPDLIPVYADLSDWSGSSKIIEDLGPIDLLVNNAAISTPKPFLEEDEERFHSLMNNNVKHVLSVSKVVARGMKERGTGGAIVNLSSVVATMVLQNYALYCATKAAISSLTKSMALELAPYKIRTNAVLPTSVKTPLSRHFLENEAISKPFIARIPLGRVAETDDVVGPILFLLSDEAAMINGAGLAIDGGSTIA